MKYQILFFTLGLLLVINGMMQIAPLLVDMRNDHHNAIIFFWCALFSFFAGGLLIINGQGFERVLTLRQTYLLTVLSWVMMSLFSANPLYFSDLHVSYTDAVFEAVSGITTTGSTVLTGLDNMSHGILLWRSMIQWVGGMGIVVFAILLLPFLKVGGMQLYKTESSDKSDKILPKTGSLVMALVTVYVGLTLLCSLAYYLLGMTSFDAVNHAMTTLSTGGYSTHDKSFGFFDNHPLYLTGTLFMLLGGLPFVLYIKLLYRGEWEFHRSPQVYTLMILLGVLVFLVGGHLVWTNQMGVWDAFVQSLFHLVSLITTTGYATSDYLTWGAPVVMICLFVTYLGSCTGSTSGGLKMMRLIISLQALKAQIFKLLYPHGVMTLHYEHKNVPPAVFQGVLVFLCLYVASNAVMTILLALTGLDFMTALSGAATAIANVGPGIGDIIGPAGNFSTLPDSAKWILCLGMVMGRLEIMSFLVLFIPSFWKG